MPLLTVYRASAGSGKTYRLALEYVKILAQNPEAYDSILAVTFTNKAAGEMKSRILSHLYGISESLKESDDFFQKVCSESNIEPHTVRKNCTLALQNILHNYSHFRVGTIDSFFQQVLRNLARELNLSANLRVELSDSDMEKAAVDKMVTDLRPGQETLKWILQQIEQNLDEDKAWNVMPMLERFSQHLSDDSFKDHRATLQRLFDAEGFFDQYSSKMYAIVKSFETTINQKIAEIEAVADQCGVEFQEFSNGSDFVSYFKKLRSGQVDDSVCGTRLQNKYNDISLWVSKTKKSSSKGSLTEAANLIHPLFVALENYRRESACGYLSSQATLRDLSNLRLLCAIDSHIHQQNAEECRFMLSDTQHFLHSFIAQSDAPFVYEKIGTRICHIMIDEFQDTSTVQWNNFRVLINDCLSSQGNSALIVGDVKQSIYRWRSGDWTLLNNIKTSGQFREDQVKVDRLQQNFRSYSSVIDFNNAFFMSAYMLESKEYDGDMAGQYERGKQYREAYSDVFQKKSGSVKQGGEVWIDIIDTEIEPMAERLVDTISYLIDQRKASPSSIAVLVRGNREISELAMSCKSLRPDLNFVSSDAYKLGQSTAVRLVMAALRYLVHPEDMLARATVVRLWFRLRGKDAGAKRLKANSEEVDALPQEFNSKLATLPLFQLVETLCGIFEVDKTKGEEMYVASLLDKVSDFVSNNSSDIEGLLQEWDREGGLANKPIPASATDGIQFLTIHKSKGLEFDNVIVPYCDWAVGLPSRPPQINWLSPSQKPFSELPVLPITMSSRLKGTIYEDDLKQELFQTSVDNMNMLYVAFTRAKCNLYVIASASKCAKNRRAKLLVDVMPNICKELSNVTIEESKSDNNKKLLSMRYGEYCKSKDPDENLSNPFLRKAKPLTVSLVTSAHRPTIVQSNQSRELFGKPYNAAAKGVALHSIFEHVSTINDFERELLRAEQEGLLDGFNVTRSSIIDIVKPQFDNPLIASWFAPGLQLFNEQSIVCHDANIKRPDRVVYDGKKVIVIDYKFGLIKEEEHQEQVANYMHMLRDMGYALVEGYLWYVTLKEIERVSIC